MTSFSSDEISRVLDYAESGRPLPRAAEAEPVLAPQPQQARSSPWPTVAVAVTLLLAYGLLQNPYWVTGGDSEVYTCIARSLAQGKGFVFNGQPVAMVPPGWPILQAGVMKVTNLFLALK